MKILWYTTVFVVFLVASRCNHDGQFFADLKNFGFVYVCGGQVDTMMLIYEFCGTMHLINYFLIFNWDVHFSFLLCYLITWIE